MCLSLLEFCVPYAGVTGHVLEVILASKSQILVGEPIFTHYHRA